MDRRGFLWTTAGIAGVAAVHASGCGAAPFRLGGDEAGTLIARLDQGLRAIRTAPPRLDPRRNQNDATERVARLGLEALVVADVARSIPQGAEIPGGLAARLQQEMPVLDRCAETYTGLLAGIPVSARRHLEEHLRARPDAAMSIAEWIDESASEHAIAYESRLKLRHLATNLTARVRRQSMSAVIDDTLGKVERVMAQHGPPVAMARQAGTNAMLASIWQTIDAPRAPGGAGTALGQPTTQLAVPPPPPSPPPGEQAPQENPGDPELAVGGVMMGAGAVVFGIATLIGAAVGNVAMGALVGATPGGTLVLVGLIVLLVGVAQNS